MSFDETKPPYNGLLISADHRANFLATRRAQGAINLLRDPLFKCWNRGSTLPPSDWTLSGAGGTILLDTTASRLGVGTIGARITYGSALLVLYQNVLSSAYYDQFFGARIVSGGAFVHASAAGIARVRIYDGVSASFSPLNSLANTLEFLPVQRTINVAANQIRFDCTVESPGSATFSGAVTTFSDIMPSAFIPPITLPIVIPFERRGTLFTGLISVWPPYRSFIIKEALVAVAVAPSAGANIIADLNYWDGLAWQSMFANIASQPQLIPGAYGPDIKSVNGTYLRRCFGPAVNGSTPLGTLISGFIDQVGVTPNEGDHLILEARGETWPSPMEIFG